MSLSRVHAVCDKTGATRKALRGYEERRLVVPARDANGWRVYDDHQVKVVSELRRLSQLGLPLSAMGPFVDCLNSGSAHADACPASLSEYRRVIERIDDSISELALRREHLVESLETASGRMLDAVRASDALNPNTILPRGLPEPVDDGVTARLIGRRLPDLRLPTTDGDILDVRELDRGSVLVYVFPMTGAPGTDMPDGWDNIPGARGCTPENCDIRNHFAALVRAGVDRVYGLSSQPIQYQQSLATTLHLPYPLLTDERMLLAQDPGLPVFTAADLTVYARHTLLIHDGQIEHVFYPVFPPDQHATQVLEHLRRRRENPEPASPSRSSVRR